MRRSHGLAQRIGIGTGVATAIAGIAIALTTTGCPASREPVSFVSRTASDARTLAEGGAYHLTLRASRALVDAQTRPLLIVARATGTGAADSITIVPDDPTLDAAVVSGTSVPDYLWSHVSIASLAAVCPAEGECELGLTIEVVGIDVMAGVEATTHRALSEEGAFPEGATLELFAD